MEKEIIYLTTTLDTDCLQEISKPNTPANHLSYELKTLLSESGVKANIKEFTDKTYTKLHIQLVCEEKFQSDKVDIAMIRLHKYYNFNWGYVSEINGKLVKNISQTNKTLNIDIFDIRIMEKLVA